MADNPAALPSPLARAGMMAWTNGVDDVDERGRTAAAGSPGLLPWAGAGQAGRGRARRYGAPSSRGGPKLVAGGRSGWGGAAPERGAAGAGRGRAGGAGAGRGRGAPDPVADQGGEGWRRGGARPGRRRAGAGFAGRSGTGRRGTVGVGVERGGRG
ncbi:uncharacterized protein [Miscanthus floridulus]|uniref:uncharacterized protein n=1 Tax=Miscanthus floridulus TaxID=154761 RepID=UPI00345A310D